MPRGVALALEIRQIIAQKFFLGYSATDVFDSVFNSTSNLISLKHLQKLRILLQDEVFSRDFLCGPELKSGRPFIINEEELDAIVDYANSNQTTILSKMKNDFFRLYHGEVEATYSLSTFNNTLHRARLSLKHIERRHINCSDYLGLQYLERICHIDPYLLIDIDEMSSSPESFHRRLGWAPVGEECKVRQITIGTRSFSTISAVTPLGFLCWDIFEGY